MTGNTPKDSLSAGPATRAGETGAAPSAAPFSQKELRELSFEIAARWFSRALSPRLTLSVVHPWRVHAYWSVTLAMMEAALATTMAPQVLVLRFFDVTPGQAGKSAEETRFDIEVDGLNNNWYIDLWQPGRRYTAELGLRGADDAFHRFVRSNEIQTPRAEPSPALAFSLARYPGVKPISAADAAPGSAFSGAGLSGLLPPFRSFADSQTDTVDPTVGEPAFPGAPLVRVQTWAHSASIDAGASTAPESPETGEAFPTVSMGTAKKEDVDTASSEPPIDYAGVPELPEIDPHTVSDSSLVAAPATPPLVLPPEQEDAGTSGGTAPNRKPQTELSRLSGDETVRSSLQEDASESGTYRRDTAGRTPAVTEGPRSTGSYMSGGPAPTPVVPLEQAIAETYSSATGDGRSLALSVQLELSGVAGAGQALTVFGEPVQVDEQGRFSVRIKLDKGPQLAALIRAQRRELPEQP